MTVTSTNTNSSAYAYLQSLLHSGASSGASANSDPLTSLMNSFYPNSPAGDTTGAVAPPPTTMTGGPTISPGSMSALIATQEQGSRTAHAQQLFAKVDADGDGKISQTEFENVFGSNADMSKVEGLFRALDNDSDGKVSSDEFASAVQNAQAQHAGRRHRHHGSGAEDGDPLQQLLKGTGANGATTQKATAADGSITTTIKYADGSSVSMTTPAASGSGTQNSTGGNAAEMNALEQLIKMQAQFVSKMSATASSVLATV